MNKKIFIDVGCHKGDYAFFWIQSKDNMVYAFEPTPELYQELKKTEIQNDNFKIYDYAVSSTNGIAIFNVNDNLATSSLRELTENQSSFRTINKLEVKTIRLDSFCLGNGITQIDLLKIDVQGADLDVLIGLGDMITKTKTIMIEAFITEKSENIYQNEVKKNEVIEYMSKYNFKIINEHIQGNYTDLTFENQNLIQ